MKKLITSVYLLLIITGVFAQQKTVAPAKSNFQQDKETIKAMAGCYKVSFEFAETFSPDTGYKYHDRKFDWGIEYVFAVEETDKKISLQHLLIVNDTMIIKHWRQDWVYENTEILNYYKDNEWRKIKLTPEQAKGTWTQKVYQVDDGPRYEGYGTWLHVDDRHFWESTSDAPLPRREFTKRNDYNVLRRHSRMELTDYGWILEQDNEKILRGNGMDKLICWEKGLEKFHKGNYNCQPAIDWWTKNTQYWSDVRKVWNEVYAQTSILKIEKRINNKVLYEHLFEMGDQYVKKPYNSAEATAAIKKMIEMYVGKTN